MGEEAWRTRAFKRASLKSEAYRVVGLLYVLAGAAVFVLVRGIVTKQYLLLAAQLVALGFVIAHEAVMLRAIRGALEDDEDLTPELWIFNVLIESQVPTVALFILLLAQWLTPWQVLVAPAIVVYFLFIILSILRLRPALTVVMGLLSALGYLFVALFVAVRLSGEAVVDRFPFPVYGLYAVLIFAASILAAAIARQFRGYVSAALREARLQSELEQINHELDIARSIQQGLLPLSPPKLEQFEI